MRQAVAVVFVFLACLGTLNAATFDRVTDADLLARADVIVVGTIVGQSVREDAAGMIYTDWRVAVEDVLKGSAAGEITITQLGGYIEGRGGIHVPGGATYEQGARVLTFLGNRPGGGYFTSHMSLGKYVFERSAGGTEILVRDGGDIEFLDHSEVMDVREAKPFIEAIRNGTPEAAPRFGGARTEARPELQPVTNGVALGYATICHGGGCTVGQGIRWATCESGCTKTWKEGVPGQNGLDTAAALSAATSTWTNEPYAFINLGISGTNTDTAPDNDNQNDIIFNSTYAGDPECSGGIGCGILYFGPEHTYESETWYSIVSSDLVITTSVTGQSLFNVVMAHEMGHGIGIRHSNEAGRNPNTTDALMNSSVPGTLSLRTWDRQAVSSIYGAGLPCEAVVISSTTGAGNIDYKDKATLKANLTGTGPFTFFWYEGQPGDTSNQVATGTTSTNATSVSFTTPALTASKTYWLRLKNCNDANTVDSSAFNVDVDPCDDADITTEPESKHIELHQSTTLSVSAAGSPTLSYQWYEGVTGDTSKPVGTNSKNFTTPMLTSTKSYWVRVTNDCGSDDSTTAIITVGNQCVAPMILQQSGAMQAEVGSGAELSVLAAGDPVLTYQWYAGLAPDESSPIAGATSATFAVGPFQTHGTFNYWVKITNGCGTAASQTIVITVPCPEPVTPQIYAPAASPRANSYEVSWTGDLLRSTTFELQEATDAAFTANVQTFTVVGALQKTIPAHAEVTVDTRFYYRVRPISLCTQAAGAYSKTVGTVVTVPLPADSSDFQLVVPAGSNATVLQNFFVPGFGESATAGDTFSVSIDVPWLTAVPSSGPLPAGGTTVQLTAASEGLPTGTAGATITLVRTQGSGAGKVGVNGTTPITYPFSMSLVTPVTPDPRSGDAPAGTLIVPGVGHLKGGGADFRSDVRIVNISGSPITYELNYTATRTDGTQEGKSTEVTINGNDSMGLDDIVKTWFGEGALGEFALGTLEIRPQGDVDPFATFASSRTYALKAISDQFPEGGTLGQFIPALRADKFVANILNDPQAKISLQQISHGLNSVFRTNLAFVEGSGSPVSFLVKLLDSNNNVIASVNRSLPAFGHEQLALDAAQLFPGVNVQNARVEVETTSDSGKVSAVASVLDNSTTDPLMVFPEQAEKVAAQTFVVPGVSEFESSFSNFHSDVQIFNASSEEVTVGLDFYPVIGDPSRPEMALVTLAPFEVQALDNTLPTVWGRSQTAGTLVVRAAEDTSLVVTSRTFSRNEDGGTFGQFIPGVTPAQATGFGERPLQVLQLEESPAFRSNVAIVETTGAPVNVELTAYDPASKLTAVVTKVLQGYESYQINTIMQQMGLGTVYSGRVTASVIGGTGRVSVFGSVVDNRTEDPTYVPGQ